MNWLGKLCEKEISPNGSVLELGCGVMGATAGLRCRELVGVDAFKEYVDYVNNKKFARAVLHDLTQLPYPFGNKSFDYVLLFDVLEHMPTLKAANGLVKEALRIARKKVFVFTPEHFDSNAGNFGVAPYDVFNFNALQFHHVLISGAWLVGYGFNVRRLSAAGGSLYAVYCFGGYDFGCLRRDTALLFRRFVEFKGCFNCDFLGLRVLRGLSCDVCPKSVVCKKKDARSENQ